MLQCAQRITEMHQNISEHVQFFKVLALDRAVRNLYISSCIFRCLHQESEKWTTKSSSGVVPVLFEQHNRSEFTMAPAQSGPLPQRNRCGIFCNSEGQPLHTGRGRCRLCRATRVNGHLPTLLGKLAARDGVLLVQGIFSGDGGSS